MTQRFRDARKLAGYTQQKAADALDVSRVTYARYETGVYEPDGNTIVKIAKLFGVTTDYLLCLTDIPNIYVTNGVGQSEATIYTQKSPSPQEQERAAQEVDNALNAGEVDVPPAMQRAIEQIVRQVLAERDTQS